MLLPHNLTDRSRQVKVFYFTDSFPRREVSPILELVYDLPQSECLQAVSYDLASHQGGRKDLNFLSL
jgi:hypothetical protein